MTQQQTVEEKLIGLVKSRVIELRTKLKSAKLGSEKTSLQLAIANNCGWLIALGQSLNIPELEEV